MLLQASHGTLGAGTRKTGYEPGAPDKGGRGISHGGDGMDEAKQRGSTACLQTAGLQRWVPTGPETRAQPVPLCCSLAQTIFNSI